jgi:hypothetical protein
MSNNDTYVIFVILPKGAYERVYLTDPHTIDLSIRQYFYSVQEAFKYLHSDEATVEDLYDPNVFSKL